VLILGAIIVPPGLLMSDAHFVTSLDTTPLRNVNVIVATTRLVKTVCGSRSGGDPVEAAPTEDVARGR
jgi:hypothetical protein